MEIAISSAIIGATSGLIGATMVIHQHHHSPL